jgi:hypothetical protein
MGRDIIMMCPSESAGGGETEVSFVLGLAGFVGL